MKAQSAGKSFKLERWQRELLRSIYNDVDEDGFRRIHTRKENGWDNVIQPKTNQSEAVLPNVRETCAY